MLKPGSFEVREQLHRSASRDWTCDLNVEHPRSRREIIASRRRPHADDANRLDYCIAFDPSQRVVDDMRVVIKVLCPIRLGR